MKKNISVKIGYLAIFMIALTAAGRAWAEPVFVIGPKVSLTSISKETAEGILKGKVKTWASGQRIDLVVLSGGPIHSAILSKCTNLDSDQFSTQWERLIFTGKATKPKAFASDAELLKYVAASDFALGYADSSSVGGDVKTLKIE